MLSTLRGEKKTVEALRLQLPGTPIRVEERPPSASPVTPSVSPATLVRNVECPPSVTLEATGNVKAPESEQGLEQAVCPICTKTVNDATELEEGDEAVFCDGECQCWLHWCCACLPKPEFDKLNEEDPFYCLSCSTLVQMKAICELRDAVAILSTQVQDLQGVINAASNKKEDVSLLNSSNDSDSATTEGWATVAGSHQRHQQDSGGGESQPSCGCSRRLDNKNNKNNANPAGRYPHGGRTGKGRGKASERERGCQDRQTNHYHAMQPSDTSEQGDLLPASSNQQDHQSSTQAPVPVTGKRRIWGTLKAYSSQAVECAIYQLTTICEDKIQVKRKYKKDRNNRLRWWHVLSGEESDLQQLESEWEKVKVQTSWKLEACLINPTFLENQN